MIRSPSTLQTTATRRPSTSAKRNGSPIATDTSCRSSVERTESPISSRFGIAASLLVQMQRAARVPSVSSPLDELRVRLAEGADLRRAAGVLGWDQRVTMPPRGTDARAEQLATLGRIAHERFVDDEVGRLLDAGEPLVESLPYDSDDRSLVRVTRRDWEKARRVPTDSARGDDSRGRSRSSRLGRGAADERLRVVSPVPADERRAQAPLRRVLRVVGQPVHAAARRLRARDADDRGARGLRRAAAGADGDRRLGARGRRVVPPRRLPARRRSARSPSGSSRRSDSRRRVAARSDRPPVLHVVLEPRRPAHDALPTRRPRVRLVDAPRGGARPLRARDRGLAAPLPARRRPVARGQRVAEPHLGEPRRAQPPFWKHWYEPLQETFPASRDVELDDFVRAINRAEPGLIRVDADETTYSLHIILRFELEQELLEGTVALERPARGVERPDEGVSRRRRARRRPRRPAGRALVERRDSATSRRTRSATSSRSSSGTSSATRCPTSTTSSPRASRCPLSDWLRDNLYSLGRKLTPKETIERLTGSPEIDPEPYLAYLRDKSASLVT